MRRYKWYVVGATLILTALLFSACRKDNGPHTTPIYTEYTYPASIKASFPKPKQKEEKDKDKKEEVKGLPNLDFNIDNRAMRVWNKIPLPYQSKFDSLDLTIAVTSEAVVKIINETTQKVTVYASNRRAQRIDATGGKLKLTVEIEKKPTLTYDLRILTYGYDPDKFTWTKESASLPIAAEDAKVLKYQGHNYWVARLKGGSSKLYEYDLSNSTFTEVEGADIPSELLPSSIAIEGEKQVWAISKDQKLYSSKDLKTWQAHDLGSVKVSQMIGEATTIDGKSNLLVIGHKEGSNLYQTYTITSSGAEPQGDLPKGFPVKEAYVYSYSQDGITAITLYSGWRADNKPSTKSYFLSGSLQWGETPYQKEKKVLPNSGGLFLPTGKEAELFVIGGLYGEANQPSSEIKRSSDKGITWIALPNQTTVGGDLLPRYSASGIASGSDKALNIYLLGGIINGEPSQEIWHGHLDTTGGIINSFN